MHKTEWQTRPDFNYRHIVYDTKRSNSKDIFNPLNYDKYRAYKLFMMLRNPVDRIISEYYFIKDRQEFMSLLKTKPKNLEDYIKNRQTQNYMVGFLLGKRMYDTDFVTKEDLSLVKNTINNLNIHIGIFENYGESLNYFSKTTGIKIPKKVEIKRMTLNRPKITEVSDSIKKLATEHNKLDFELYEYGLKLFAEASKNISKKTVAFKGDKYSYVLKYTERFNLLEIGLTDKWFINNNHQTYFDPLNLYLHQTLGIKNGKSYVKVWNAHFISTINSFFPNTELATSINKIEIDEPLGKTEAICKHINMCLKKAKNKYTKKLNFNQAYIDTSLLEKKKGFLSNLFK